MPWCIWIRQCLIGERPLILGMQASRSRISEIAAIRQRGIRKIFFERRIKAEVAFEGTPAIDAATGETAEVYAQIKKAAPAPAVSLTIG
jgi:hypothetical protein